MKTLRSTSSFLLITSFALSTVQCSNIPGENMDSMMAEDSVQTSFDEELAEELGADHYGMRQYVMAFLKSGPNPSADSTEAMQLQRAHLDNITRMAEEGDLVLAGPFMDSGEVRGIYVFDVRTVEEARALTESDPAIQAGALEMELHPWYGSAALMQVNEIHSRISRESP